jgi:hypothetical protein
MPLVPLLGSAADRVQSRRRGNDGREGICTRVHVRRTTGMRGRRGVANAELSAANRKHPTKQQPYRSASPRRLSLSHAPYTACSIVVASRLSYVRVVCLSASSFGPSLVHVRRCATGARSAETIETKPDSCSWRGLMQTPTARTTLAHAVFKYAILVCVGAVACGTSCVGNSQWCHCEHVAWSSSCSLLTRPVISSVRRRVMVS